MTNLDIAIAVGISPQRVQQLRARGDSIRAILTGVYKRTPKPAKRCPSCGKYESTIRHHGHRRGCSRGKQGKHGK